MLHLRKYLKRVPYRFILILSLTALLGLVILPSSSLSKAKLSSPIKADYSTPLSKQGMIGETVAPFSSGTAPPIWYPSASQSASLLSSSNLIVQQGAESGPKIQQQDDDIEEMRTRVFANFESWTKAYLSTGNPSSLKAKGIDLAARRMGLLKDLILSDPARVLALAISPDKKQRFPSEIGNYLEEQVSGYGDYIVLVSDQIDPLSGALVGSHTDRMVIIQGKVYKAAVYGRWLNMTSKKNIPLNGIVIDGVMVINESPVRMLSPTELADLAASGKLTEGEIAADIGGKVHYFKNEQDLSSFSQALVSREMIIGPDTEEHKNRLSAEASQVTADSAWTEGPKTVLFIRIDFPDKPGEPLDSSNQPLTVARAQSLMDTQISPFYVSNSYNKTSMQTTVTPVVRMPQPQSFYFKNSGDLFKDAENAARIAGFEANNFNLDIFAMSYNQGFDYAGIGSVGSRGAALNGYFDLRVTAHELGHNYGLSHANLWRTTDGTVIGNGSNIEYGNSFDTMGAGGDARFHFNAQYKRRLNWLTDANVQTVTNDGVYRIFAQDSSTPGGIRAIKIRKGATKNYWIEFRQLFTNNPNALNGAIINWDYLSANFAETQLLDMTPNTSTDATDSPLLIGRNFYDDENRIRMTVLGKGNTTPQSLDVKVELNVGCTFSIGQTTQSFPASGGEGSITVNTQGGCRVVPTSNDSWLYAVPSDTGTVRYIVAANYDSQPRTGTINVAGQTFTVQQGASTTACVGRPSGLVAWWRGEGNALDQTGVNNGTLINNMTFGGGKVGGGFLGNFSNNAGIVQVLDSPSLALNRSMTFEGWLRLDSYGGTVIERRDDTSSGNLASSYHVDVDSSGRLVFFISFNRSQGVGAGSPNPLPLNQFVHFAATLDDATSQIKTYINGSLASQFTISQRPYDLDPNANPRVNIGNVNGITDELSVYNRALSASEIQSIYNAGIASTGATGKCLFLSAILATVQTNPTGRAFTVDGTNYSTAQTFSWILGSNHTISTTSPQSGVIGTQYVWSNWSDGGTISHSVTPSSDTTYTANFTTQSVEPPNNNFANAQVVSGNSGSVMGSNVNATKEAGEPNHASNNGGVSVWYQWQAPASGSVTINTAGSSFDTLLGVYTGNSVNALTTIASNDDENNSGGVFTSKVVFNAVGGTTYRIAVDGFGGARGNITLNWNLIASCTYTISPTNQSFTFSAGTSSVSVTTASGCGWSAASNSSFITITSGASGTSNGTVNYSVAANTGPARTGTLTIAGQTFTVNQAGIQPTVQLSASSYAIGEAAGNVAVVVNRTDTSATATVDYATTDTAGLTACNQANGIASSRCDYANTVGTLRFAIGESSKTIFIPVVDDGYMEGTESFTVKLSNPTGASLGTNSTATVTITDNDSSATNPIVGVPFFVRQQYIDFLGREPDPAGFSAWQSILNNCSSGDTSCDRIAVSSGFFRSPEFQDRGSFIFRFYSAALGRNPSYTEFVPDLAKVSGFLSDAQLEANKVAFVNEFMTRSEYVSRYGSLSNAAYVDALIQAAGMTGHPLRDAWIGVLNNGSATRAQVLRAFTESVEVYQKFYNQAFVVMQYFGYLRRDPDASYTTWINMLNQSGDYRGMISGFMNSNEYVLRFGP